MDSIMISTPIRVVMLVIRGGDALVQALAQGVHVVGDAAEHLAHRALLEIGQGAGG